MYLKSKPAISKMVSVALLCVVIGVWINAYNKSIMKELFRTTDVSFTSFYEICKSTSGCPHEIKQLEIAAFWIPIVFLGIMLVNLVACNFMDTKGKFYSTDYGVTLLAAIAISISAIMMLYCTIRADIYFDLGLLGLRDDAKYVQKLVAGGIAVICAISLFGTTSAIKKYRNPVTQVVVVQQPQFQQQQPQYQQYPVPMQQQQVYSGSVQQQPYNPYQPRFQSPQQFEGQNQYQYGQGQGQGQGYYGQNTHSAMPSGDVIIPRPKHY